MKKTYHLCLSAGEEVMFRDHEDYNRGFNCFALALYKTGSTGLVESFMSTHVHMLVQTSDPKLFMGNFRKSYCMYFNHKYKRKGKLGENMHFAMEVIGYHHMIAAASYILRNALHHGAASIAYGYPHSSINAIFRKEMGKFHQKNTIPAKSCSKYIGRRARFPKNYIMNESGAFTRESVLDIPQVENLFVTPRTFNYYMNRKSGEEWEKEQMKDGNETPPVTLYEIERGINLHSIDSMLYYENGKADYRKISDIELCMELDKIARYRYGRHSVYQLTDKEKQDITEHLCRTMRLGTSQIHRCLAITYPRNLGL